MAWIGVDDWSFVNAGWFSALLAFVLFVLGSAVTIVIYHKTRVQPRLSMVLASSILIDKPLAASGDQLEIIWEGMNVPRVTVTTLGIWNDGTVTFRCADMVEGDPLRLKVGAEAEVLQIEVAGESRPQIGVEVGASDDTAYFSFDFLDPGDGLRLRLTHTGLPSNTALAGTIIGLPRGISERQRSYRPVWTWWFAWMIVGASGLSSGLVAQVVARDNLTMSTLAFLSFVIIVFVSAISYVSQSSDNGKERLRGVPPVIADDDMLYGRLASPIAK